MPQVRYRWLTEDKGGRRELPCGPKMRYPIKLLVPNSTWDKEAWDVLFEFHCPPDRISDCVGTIEYWMPNAPHETLVAGTEFELMEGSRPVVRGVIL